MEMKMFKAVKTEHVNRLGIPDTLLTIYRSSDRLVIETLPGFNPVNVLRFRSIEMYQELYLIRIPKEHLPATICNILVKPGDKIEKTQSLLRYEYVKLAKKENIDPMTKEQIQLDVDTPFVEELKSPTEGEIQQIFVKDGESIFDTDDKAVIGVKEPCVHSIQIHGLCALCGNDMMKTDFTGVDYSQRATISMAHDVAGLTVSLNEAERLEKETAARLLKSRKLSLIVDLDQTLIHATVESTVDEWINDENHINNPTIQDIHKFVLSDSPTVYYIKLSVSEFYEPHIYTMGTRNYASSVANIIDPVQKIFNERILSRDESRNITQKTIRRLFPCDDSMVVAIDDRADVWGWSPNLIKVHPYDFFVGIGDINDTRFSKQPKPTSVPTSVPTIATPEENNVKHEEVESVKPVLVDNDTELPNLLKALKAIHKRYYDEYDRMQSDLQTNGKSKMPDVTVLVPSMKAEVLKGVNILFTHVIPTSQKKESAEIWILAKEFGAVCSENWNNDVTHLVAGDRGTEKVKEAIRRGNIFIVRKEWLHDSIKKWERQPERDYFFDTSIRESESEQVSEIEKPPDLIVETPVNEITDDEGLLSPQERQEHFLSTDWKSILCEVEEEIGDWGDTSALDESETESGTESNGRIKLKRNSSELNTYEQSAKRLKHSPLRHAITFDDYDDDEDSNTNVQEDQDDSSLTK
ncbi:19525_t:CDS:10 [Cetraspora pellucida]|uniref:RNA polymerase II subunit A C-terminal domain phosphatase n=2 Tax=Cetraspora pellucida TaxID=1433469 RepID=A0A9N9GHG9_9GLOM|nr:19525_t:CDS:10 [Cetraspora pellucida]